MRIGLDLDNTICSTDKTIKKYEYKYCKENKIDSQTLLSSENIKCDFLNNYLEVIYNESPLKKNTKNVINRLKKMKNEIIIITARRNRYINNDMRDFIIQYLNNKKIFVDEVVIDAKDKVEVCKNLNIDIILEDNLYNYNSLTKSGVNVVLYDETNQYSNIKNRISNWIEFLKYIK